MSVATLHHRRTERGLLRLRELVRPARWLGIIGLAAGELPHDLARKVAAAIGARLLKLKLNYWEHSAPKASRNPDSYTQVRRIAEARLPGPQCRNAV